MFGIFKGLFGEGTMGKAAEMALDMCIMDEMKKDTAARVASSCAKSGSEKRAHAAGLHAEKRALIAAIKISLNTIQETVYALEKASNIQDVLDVGGYLPAFYTYLFYDLVRRAPIPKQERYALLTKLLDLCPESMGLSGQEVFTHVKADDDIGHLICLMKSFPVVILDLSDKTGREEDGERFLNAFPQALCDAGRLCACDYPSVRFYRLACEAGIELLDHLEEFP